MSGRRPTGRFEKERLPFQRLPLRGEDARRLRNIFSRRSGYFYCEADYEALELRAMAALYAGRNGKVE